MPAQSDNQAVAARIAGAIKKGLQKPEPGSASAEMAKMPMKSLKKFMHKKGEKKEGLGFESMYAVKNAIPEMKESDLVVEFNPLEGIQGQNISMEDVHSVHATVEDAQAIAAEVYKKCMDEATALEEKKGKVGDKLKKTIDHLEKKRKEHVDLAKEDPKNASKHKEHIAKIATQIDDLMSKMEKIEKSKKNIEKAEDKKENLKEAFEVHFSDGVRQAKKFKDPKSALNFAKELISTNKNLQHVDVFNAGPNFNSTADTDSVIAWWGDGSYMDNKSKKDPKLAAKKIK